MAKFQYYSTDSLIRFFIEQGKEGDCWDFKQEWHENMADLVKDIICFANTVHDENCYLIFGVADNMEITGMKKPRKKQADIIDAISNLIFAGDVYPAVEVETILFDGDTHIFKETIWADASRVHIYPGRRQKHAG